MSSPRPFSRIRTFRAPATAAAVALGLYLATLSRHYTGDSIEYALAIELGDSAFLLDPYHPLLHPLGLAFYRLWQAFGWTGQSLLPLQILNALAGAMCAGLVADIARRLTGSSRLALLAGLGFAVSGGVWMLSVEAEFVTVPLAFALLVLWVLLAASPDQAGKAWYAILLALVTILAFSTYATGAILLFVVVIGILMDSRLEGAIRRRQVLIYGSTFLIVAVPASLVFLAQWSQGDWARVPAYFFSRGGYSRFVLSDLPHGVYGLLRSLALYPRLSLVGTTSEFLAQASPTARGLWVVYYTLVLLIVCMPLALAVRYRNRLLASHRRTLAVLTVWSAGYALAAVYWVPGDVSFWLPVLAAWWLLLALVFTAETDADMPTKKRRLPAALAIAVVALAVANAVFEVLPRHNLSTNLPYQVAADVAAQTGETDLFLTRPDDISGLYLAYFGGRQVLYATPATLDRLHHYLVSSPEPPVGRVLVVDADGERLDWWGSTLAASQWQLIQLAPQQRDGLLIELSSW
ncbi:MAG: DUF2723 domain-containing protein [Anaerolineae bacterium]|nr:DUF2723 domain-containing protein [Anaerolineae bacterium]